MHQSVSIIFSSFSDFLKKKQNNSHISNQIQLNPLMDNPDRFEVLSKIRKITVLVANSTCSWLFSYGIQLLWTLYYHLHQIIIKKN